MNTLAALFKNQGHKSGKVPGIVITRRILRSLSRHKTQKAEKEGHEGQEHFRDLHLISRVKRQTLEDFGSKQEE